MKIKEKGERVFSFEGLTIRVNSYDSSHLKWLEEFIFPAFKIQQESAADIQINLTHDPGRFKQLIRQGSTGEKKYIDIFKEECLERFSIWREDEKRRIVFDEQRNIFYFIGRDNREYEILLVQDSLKCRIPLKNLIRQSALAHLRRKKNLIFQAAAFAVGENGVIVAGPKRCGKTTLLTSALQAGGTRYIANDRVFLKLNGETPTIHGIPNRVSIGPETLNRFPQLTDRLQLNPFQLEKTIAETRKLRTRPPENADEEGQATALTPAQYCGLLNAPSIERAKLTTLIFPEFDAKENGFRLRPVGLTKAALIFQNNLLEPDSFPQSKKETLKKLFLEIVFRTQCFSCRIGPAPFENQAWITSLNLQDGSF